MAVSQKTCATCGTNNPPEARFCSNCGTPLNAKPAREDAPATYSALRGETDLMEADNRWRGGNIIVSILAVFALLLCGGVGFFAWGSSANPFVTVASPPPTSAAPSLQAPVQAVINTSTPFPTRQLSTVTPAPPTITPIPTLGPCQIEVQTGSTLYGIIALCGHRDFDVLEEVAEINGISPDGTDLQLGQVLEVPRPTATLDPSAPTSDAEGETEGEASSAGFAGVLFAEGADGFSTSTPRPTPTLPVGVQWYTVQSGENIAVVANNFRAGVEVLSQLNPEVDFAQCDFGEFTGGPDCTVLLQVGQRLRVPAPTPTPTLSPTPSGSETSTPTATATFNAPNLSRPGNRALFRSGELVTLRWSGTGTLGEDETYRVRLKNLDTGLEYTTDVRQSYFVLPTAWQERDGNRYEYEWRVSVIDLDNPQDPIYVTESRLFTWEAVNEEAEENDE